MLPALFAPKHYAAAEPADIVRRYPFGLFITAHTGNVYATSTPMYFETDKTQNILVGHMARRNAHAQVLESEQKFLAVFSGPNAYISGAWYVDVPEVPTWNYVAAHVRGVISPIDDDDAQLAILQRIGEIQEKDSADAWTLSRAPEGRVARLLPYIRSFRLAVEQIEGVTKLSQTHPSTDRLRVISHLLSKHDGDSSEIARLMSGLGLD